MIYPDVKLEAWIKKTGIEPITYTCAKCGGEYKTTVPVITKDYVGLVSPTHGCGAKFTKLVFCPRTKEKKDLWAKVFDIFSSQFR